MNQTLIWYTQLVSFLSLLSSQTFLIHFEQIIIILSNTLFCMLFLDHLSTKCSWWAIVVSGLSVVRRASTFNVYTLETTFVIGFLWNFVRMFVLTISRPSSNMGHVGLKTKSPGQILGNFCLHSKGHICDPMLMKLCQNVCFDNF